MLTKLTLSNVHILNIEELKKRVDELHEYYQRQPEALGKPGSDFDQLTLWLKPTWYAQHAILFSMFSIPGGTVEDAVQADALQSATGFLSSKGLFSFDKDPEDSEIYKRCSECGVTLTEDNMWSEETCKDCAAELGLTEEEGIPLYFGDNGLQEFWEDEEQRFLIFKVKGQSWGQREPVWQAFKGRGKKETPHIMIDEQGQAVHGESLDEVIARVEDLHGVNLVKDTSKHYVGEATEDEPMKLVSKEETE